MSVLDVVSTPASAVGRYFSVLTVIPSTLLVSYLYALAQADPWTGRVEWARAGRAFTDLGLGGVAVLALVSLLVGLLLHPLQFSLVQFCEGYWGTSRSAQAAMNRRILYHRKVRASLLRLQGAGLRRLIDAGQSPNHPDARQVDAEHLPDLSAYGEASRLILRYPRRRNDVRPTRLGNVLRRYEADAGARYNLPGVTITPHLTVVAAPADLAYLNDQRTLLDLTVRLVVLSALATACTGIALWRCGLWLLLMLVPYTATYLFYRGAVGVAEGYGTALMVLIDMNRLALYDRLGMVRPPDMGAERTMNAALGRLLRDLEPQNLPLAPQAAGTGVGASAASPAVPAVPATEAEPAQQSSGPGGEEER